MRNLAVVVLCGWLLGGNALALTLQPVVVGKNVYAFIGDTGMRSGENEGMNANAGFIVTNAGVVVVDSGSSFQVARAMHQAIRQVTRQPVKYVINTGGQDHRWLGNGYFRQQGAVIIASRKARADMEARGAMQMAGLQQTLQEKFAGTEAVYPERLFDQQDTLQLGGVQIQLLHFGGGHTPGDSVVWLPQSRILFAGDLVFVDRLLGVWPFSNTRDWLASFSNIEKLQPQHIVPGHGAVTDLAKAQRDTRDYLLLLRNHMQQALAQGQYLQEAVDSLNQLGFAGLRNFDVLSRSNASNTYLEMEME